MVLHVDPGNQPAVGLIMSSEAEFHVLPHICTMWHMQDRTFCSFLAVSEWHYLLGSPHLGTSWLDVSICVRTLLVPTILQVGPRTKRLRLSADAATLSEADEMKPDPGSALCWLVDTWSCKLMVCSPLDSSSSEIRKMSPGSKAMLDLTE